jgi:hypothetical protein
MLAKIVTAAIYLSPPRLSGSLEIAADSSKMVEQAQNPSLICDSGHR